GGSTPASLATRGVLHEPVGLMVVRRPPRSRLRFGRAICEEPGQAQFGSAMETGANSAIEKGRPTRGGIQEGAYQVINGTGWVRVAEFCTLAAPAVLAQTATPSPGAHTTSGGPLAPSAAAPSQGMPVPSQGAPTPPAAPPEIMTTWSPQEIEAAQARCSAL